MIKAIIRLALPLLITGCMAQSEETLPTLVDFPSPSPSLEAQAVNQNASESPMESSTTSLVTSATENSASTTSSPTPLADTVWLSLAGAKAYACPSLDCGLVLELPAGLRFVPLESTKDWHTVRLDANQMVYIQVAFTRQLSEAEANASATPTGSASPTASATASPVSNSVVVATNPASSGGNPVQAPVTGGQNPNPIVVNTVASITPLVVNTLLPTYTEDLVGNTTDLPATVPSSRGNDLPFLPTLTPTITQAPPPIIVLPPVGN